MEAVFLNNKTYEIVYPAKETEDKNYLYSGMNEPIEMEHKIWIRQYLRVDDQYFPDFAFVADEEENILFVPNQEYSFLTKKLDGKLYFIPEDFNIHLVGDTRFFYQKDGEAGSVHVRILSMLDDETYEEIRKDLTAISIRLLYKAKMEKMSLRIRQEYLSEYDLEIRQLAFSIKELERLLNALNQDPMTDMTSKPARLDFRQVKRLDANIIMDHYVLKKPKVRTMVHQKTVNTYENRKIFSFLKLLEKRLAELELEITERQKQNNPYDEAVSTEETKILGPKRSLSQMQQMICQMQMKLQEFYKLNMFQNEAFKPQKVYPLKASNLFVNHEKYRKIFHEMQTYREVGELLEDGLKLEYNSVHKSPDIYEIWSYFKILEIFILEKNYRIDRVSWPGKISEAFYFETWAPGDYRKLLGRIRDYIRVRENRDSVKSLEELVIHLVNGKKDIYLGYNCTFRGRVVPRVDRNEKGNIRYSTDRLRPDIFLILNKEIYFSCDAKYKNYKKIGMGIQAWYTDLFECAAYKYIYRLDLGNAVIKNVRQGSVLSVQERFVEADSLKSTLKNGGACILTPAIADCEEPAKYNGYKIEEKYTNFLEYLKEGKVNRDTKGRKLLDPEEYSMKLKEKIMDSNGGPSDYEYRVASTRFLPREYRGFKLLFLEALKYGQAHFLEEMW